MSIKGFNKEEQYNNINETLEYMENKIERVQKYLNDLYDEFDSLSKEIEILSKL